MERFVLSDAQWAKMEPHCLGKPTDPGRSGSDNRRFVEAVLWIVRTGSANICRDLVRLETTGSADMPRRAAGGVTHGCVASYNAIFAIWAFC